jgi:hypothetical protein
MSRHEVHIEPVTLAPGDVLHIELIVDGSGDDLEIQSPVPIVEEASFVPRGDALDVELDYDKSVRYRLNRFARQLIRPSSRGY